MPELQLILRSPSEAAGVICPKETGEMKTEDCHDCQHFIACWNALMEELEDTDHEGND